MGHVLPYVIQRGPRTLSTAAKTPHVRRRRSGAADKSSIELMTPTRTPASRATAISFQPTNIAPNVCLHAVQGGQSHEQHGAYTPTTGTQHSNSQRVMSAIQSGSSRTSRPSPCTQYSHRHGCNIPKSQRWWPPSSRRGICALRVHGIPGAIRAFYPTSRNVEREDASSILRSDKFSLLSPHAICGSWRVRSGASTTPRKKMYLCFASAFWGEKLLRAQCLHCPRSFMPAR
ncbi:hypothetical protein BC628DRAFT_481178 [Trametes gibbosa]|nr:hypothetical protein BC628DRAFT_481178 [Trametes gibbosa]